MHSVCCQNLHSPCYRGYRAKAEWNLNFSLRSFKNDVTETFISVYVVSRMTLLSSYWPSLNLMKKSKQPVFGCCSAGGWCQRKLNRITSRSLKWAEFVSCVIFYFSGLYPFAYQAQGKGQIFVTVYRDRINSVLDSYSGVPGLNFRPWDRSRADLPWS